MKNYSLVLSGGGALGYAHLGILEDLEKLGYEKPSEIVGTSMGAIIGAAYACGKSPNEIYETLKHASKWKNWIRLSLRKKGMFSHRKILAQLDNEFGGARMGDTDIELALVATNKRTGERRVFNNTDKNIRIADAVVASMALPTLFPDKAIDGKVYIDGCYSANCAISAASKDNIIASNVLGWNSFNSVKRHDLDRSMRIMLANQTSQDLKLVTGKQVQYIDLDTKDYGTLAFSKIDEIKKIGTNCLS